MVKVTVAVGDGDEVIGDFELEQLPRAEEYIYVPSATDPEGVRIFQVTEINHIAAGVPKEYQFGPGPRVVLRYCEEIGSVRPVG